MKITKKDYEVLEKFDSLLKDKFKLNKIAIKWDAEKLRLAGENIPLDVKIVETYRYEIKELV